MTSPPTTEFPWNYGSLPATATRYPIWDNRRSSMPGSLQIGIDPNIVPMWAPGYMVPIREGPTRNRLPSKGPSKPLPDNWETAQTWKEADQNDFDNFHYDYNPYAEELPAAPFPLPDSPNHEYYPHQQHHPRRISGYHPPQYGIYLMGGGDNPDRQEGGSDLPPPDPEEEE
ncbi:uncharacterized protein ARMOST_14262 [Armillaria ostoyae]|uniref:Uncharacterized protein n=1 Tax=Armillaria ostoyae TaxID=47428 RepID=A0A284RQ23_ARMOS|nr:uncharacterized protein ARMOST_14262 [Armillaria ostoyae]